MSFKPQSNIISLKEKIVKTFQDNINYSNPNQAVNQADSLDALSKDLYADSKRFIYELLQNADDSAVDGKSVNVWIKIIGNNLIVSHSGKPFDERDIQGICNINNGTKKSDITKTGYKGIGFKSVFGQSQKVIIFTNSEYFKFDANYKHNWQWEESSQDKWEKENDRKFQYPWQIIPIYLQSNEIETNIHEYLQSIKATVATVIELKTNNDIIASLQELSQKTNMYLFLKNISNIIFDTEQRVNIAIDRKANGKIHLECNNSCQSTWLSKTFEISIPKEIKNSLSYDQNIPDKFKYIDKVDLTLSAQVKDGSIVKLHRTDKLLYSYLPTDETKYDFPVLVNTSFLTTANRESLHASSTWNQWLFTQIGTKLFEWIAELVQSEYQFQAYNLLPNKILSDTLGQHFNKAMDIALQTISFIPVKNGNLVKVKDAIVDFTFLSDKDYIGEEPIKKLLTAEDKHFTKNTGYGKKLNELGATTFEWKNVPDLLLSVFFQSNHSTKNNIDLINHFHYLCHLEKTTDVKAEDMKNISFILDHKKVLCVPQQISFPSSDDTKWNDQTTSLSFVHEDIQIWLRNKPDIKNWLESLGVTEKTDTTYIEQIIIPNIETYITSENAISAMQDLFRLYEKGDLKRDLIERLSQIRLLTKNGSLKPANECHLSNFYDPRFAIEEISDLDIFVSNLYCIDESNRSGWKLFFKMMRVRDSTTIVSYPQRRNKNDFIKEGYRSEYFNAEDKRFSPFQSTFSSDAFQNIIVISYIEAIQNNIKFSRLFWRDFISNNEPSIISNRATAFWGYHGRPGQRSGDPVGNYIPWYIENISCIPTTDGNCYSSPNVFLNTQEIIDIGTNYLPIFDCIDLTPEWRAFFNFNTKLELKDYLSVLAKISQDTEDKGVVKKSNIQRINIIYKNLLNQCLNWGGNEITIIKTWIESNKLLNTHNQFTKCCSLKYFIDGNESIFQEQFSFINLDAENRQHPRLETLLNYLGIQLLRQSDFELIPIDKSKCIELEKHLTNIIPYFRIWIEHDVNHNIETLRALEDLQSNINKLSINHATELKIQYSEINFTKDTNVHFDREAVYVTNPWHSNSVLLTLPTQLCRFLGLQGHDKKLDFLLRSKIEEIQKYFLQENITISEEILSQYTHQNQNNQTITSISGAKSSLATHKKVSSEYFHMSEADLEKFRYAESIISRSMAKILQYLSTHNDYDCTNHYEITNSIIGGIKKNGHEIAIVARPSDNNQVILYDGSEFDVLSHADAEFWHEDGETPPRQIRIGQLITQLDINRIPIRKVNISTNNLTASLKAKSKVLDFDVIPFVPAKMARVIASFANTDGGKIMFGVKENTTNSVEIVGLDINIDVVGMVQKAISMLSHIPIINYEWVHVEGKNIFLIEVEKQNNNNILLNDMKYIRAGVSSILEKGDTNKKTLNNPDIKRTFAIIISIENYAPRGEKTISPVKYANNDSLEFEKLLINSMNVKEEDIYSFTDSQALRSDLQNGLKSIFFQLTENDRLVFYYAGHGFHNGITNYLTTYDTYPSNLLDTTVSLREILLDPLKGTYCKNALIFIDSCAEHLQKDSQRNTVFNMDYEEFMLIASEFPSYSIFLSCQTGESSFSCDELKHGVWTYHLIKALSGDVKKINNCEFITDKSLRDYLSTHVSKYVNEQLHLSQNPKAILESSYENIII
ncbi:sacsin N-terminal ATP-binding-like domain-containing protein [Citrobacter freundii complex sp. CFNIH9]|nr:caspase family protein [Citrobacter freundii complex sp. CFNIH9]AUV08178.1 transcriptional regulator [Enterobacteriaceae bacterium ENNIH2]AUV44276.1 transcriptional regulator [Citrobacter freundii complex sp. CFNIH9]